jgi:CDGSH-type Zn-finger protein/uncharacterized Fe-S cluster protein YjdI
MLYATPAKGTLMSSDVYHGKIDDRRYTGDQADITYNLKRCIHAQECIHRLSTVFDNKRRPWIDASQAAPDAIQEVVALCPSGALHLDRKDGGENERQLTQNTITLWKDGPLQLRGNLTIQGAHTEVVGETRATLCRCGESHNKPFCDNSHKDVAFIAEDSAAPITLIPTDNDGTLTITAEPNGPLGVMGQCAIYAATGEVLYQGTETWLCRCGGSANKPFCDGTHKRKGFVAE